MHHTWLLTDWFSLGNRGGCLLHYFRPHQQGVQAIPREGSRPRSLDNCGRKFRSFFSYVENFVEVECRIRLAGPAHRSDTWSVSWNHQTHADNGCVRVCVCVCVCVHWPPKLKRVEKRGGHKDGRKEALWTGVFFTCVVSLPQNKTCME